MEEEETEVEDTGVRTVARRTLNQSRGSPPLVPKTPRDAEPAVPLKWMDAWADLLDARFKIPGTHIRFGLDFLLGLVPGIGDAISLGFSGILVATMAKHGASPWLVVRMLINVLLDATLGSVPLVGNLFDLFFKANHRNAKLLRQHYEHRNAANASRHSFAAGGGVVESRSKQISPAQSMESSRQPTFSTSSLVIGTVLTVVIAIGLLVWSLIAMISFLSQLIFA